MRKLSIILFLNFLILSCYSFAQSWYIINPTSIEGNPNLTDVFFVNDNLGWITTDTKNEVYKTSDGGSNFTVQNTPLGATLAIQMLDENNGYCGGHGGWIYKTENGGASWNILASMGTFTDISFPPNTNLTNPIGYACGDGGNVWEVTSTLINLNSSSSSTFRGISSPSVNNVWVCGGNHVYFSNGINFYDQSTPGGTFNDIHFVNNQDGWVVGDNGIIGRTNDGGNVWTSQNNPDNQNRALIGVYFINSLNGWAVGTDGLVLQTQDGGTNWEIVADGLTNDVLTSVHFTSINNGYVVGNNGILLKYGLPLVTKDENSIPKSFELKQNYPNPFNPNTIIEFSIKDENIVILKIYDIGGNEVATILNERLQSGNHQVEFNAENLSNGTYLYKLQVGDEVQTRKMVLIK